MPNTENMKHRSVLLVLTIDDDELMVSTADGTPRRITSENAFAKLRDIAGDPLVPTAKLERSGFDVGETLRGIGKFFADVDRGGDGGR